MGQYTDLLYNRPSFISGLARCLDIGATLREFNTCPTGRDADRMALASDCFAVGEDMRQVIAEATRKTNPKGDPRVGR